MPFSTCSFYYLFSKCFDLLFVICLFFSEVPVLSVMSRMGVECWVLGVVTEIIIIIIIIIIGVRAGAGC